jgi:hypothetical protein
LASLFLAVFLPLALIVYSVASFFWLGRDARALRNVLLQETPASPDTWKKTVEFNIGQMSCFAVRTGLSFLPLDRRAAAALGALESAEAGVYRIKHGGLDGGSANFLSRADTAMAKRGWEPLVKVANREESVMVYVPQGAKGSSSVRVCLAVLQRNQLVIVSARANPQPLLELAMGASQQRNGRILPNDWQL